jgi:uncharacterized BrkB/YihY/UPF0761 family membrane protein
MTGPEPPREMPVAESNELEDAITRSRMERLKLEQQRVIGRVERARERLESKRPTSRIIDTALGAFERDVAAGGGVLAGALAFRIFLFMIPYVFLVAVVFGLGASVDGEAPGRAARDAGISGIAAKAFDSVGDLSTSQRLISFFVAAFALILATRALLKVLRIVHALVWHTRAGKPASATRAAGVLVLIVTLALGLAALAGALRNVSFLVGIIGTLVYVLVPIAVWVFVSWSLPHAPDVPWPAFLPGAVVLGVGLEVLHIVTVYWIAHLIESKTDTYGAIGFALALLLWAYLLGRLITTAAVVNETYWSRDVQRRQARAAVVERRRAEGDDRGGEVGGAHPPQT